MSKGSLCGPLDVRFLIVSASDWLLSDVVARFGSFCTWEVKLEPNLCLDGSEAVLGMGVKFSL